MKRNKPNNPDYPPDEEDLGWTFNNEIILNLQELEILRKKRSEVRGQSTAVDKRIEGINAIKKYINRNRDSEEHINQVIALNNSNQSQIQEIDDWIVQRERTLATCVAGFKEYLSDYEKSHPKNRKWHKTLKVAEEYLKNYSERG